jgi:hypothetical protein
MSNLTFYSVKKIRSGSESETILSDRDSLLNFGVSDPTGSGSTKSFKRTHEREKMQRKKPTLTFRFYELFLLWFGQRFTQLTEQRNHALCCVTSTIK